MFKIHKHTFTTHVPTEPIFDFFFIFSCGTYIKCTQIKTIPLDKQYQRVSFYTSYVFLWNVNGKTKRNIENNRNWKPEDVSGIS